MLAMCSDHSVVSLGCKDFISLVKRIFVIICFKWLNQPEVVNQALSSECLTRPQVVCVEWEGGAITGSWALALTPYCQ